MTSRTASCRCGQLRATVGGEPVRASVCHCLNCQKRSGSAFAVQVRWPAEKVAIEGRSATFVKSGDSGGTATFHFCPDCGSDVYYLAGAEDLVAIPIGAFDEPYHLPLNYSVYESRKHPWVEIDASEHYD